MFQHVNGGNSAIGVSPSTDLIGLSLR